MKSPFLFSRSQNSAREKLEWSVAAQRDTAQQSFLTQDINVQLYSLSNPRQKAITKAIMKGLIFYCSLPLSLVENTCFRTFMWVVDVQYCPVSRSTVTVARRLSELASVNEAKIKMSLEKAATVSVISKGDMHRPIHRKSGPETRVPSLCFIFLV